MARCGAGVTRSGVNTANTAYFNLDNTGTGRLFVRQVIVNISVAPSTAPMFYLSRATARGTQASTLAGLVLDEGDTQSVVGTLDVCGTGGNVPTFSTTNWLATGALAVTAGGSYIWTFYDAPIVVKTGAGNGLCVANANASGATTGTFTCSMLWDDV